jgi:hypothetical protein
LTAATTELQQSTAEVKSLALEMAALKAQAYKAFDDAKAAAISKEASEARAAAHAASAEAAKAALESRLAANAWAAQGAAVPGFEPPMALLPQSSPTVVISPQSDPIPSAHVGAEVRYAWPLRVESIALSPEFTKEPAERSVVGQSPTIAPLGAEMSKPKLRNSPHGDGQQVELISFVSDRLSELDLNKRRQALILWGSVVGGAVVLSAALLSLWSLLG